MAFKITLHVAIVVVNMVVHDCIWFPLVRSLCVVSHSCSLLTIFTDTRVGPESDKEELTSPRGRQRKISTGSDAGTPTPRSAAKKIDDRHFFGSNFSLDNLDMTSLTRTAFGRSS